MLAPWNIHWVHSVCDRKTHKHTHTTRTTPKVLMPCKSAHPGFDWNMFISTALKSQKTPNHTDTWSHSSLPFDRLKRQTMEVLNICNSERVVKSREECARSRRRSSHKENRNWHLYTQLQTPGSATFGHGSVLEQNVSRRPLSNQCNNNKKRLIFWRAC